MAGFLNSFLWRPLHMKVLAGESSVPCEGEVVILKRSSRARIIVSLFSSITDLVLIRIVSSCGPP